VRSAELIGTLRRPPSIANPQQPKEDMSFFNRKLRANGLEFNVRDIGAGEPILVFIHYWGGTGRTWDLVAEQLSSGQRCVAPDLRGWGASDKTTDGYDLHTQADDVAAIVRTLGLSQYILVCQSMGGKIAQIFGARRPPGLKGLVLVAPAPPTPMPVPKEQRESILDSYQSQMGYARSNNPQFRREYDEILDGLRKAGVREQ
jgi:pimeloyl-ACP methyl ester carboxylesterase